MILKITPQVYDDLEDIRKYIAEDSVSNIEQMLSIVTKNCMRLRLVVRFFFC